MATTRNIFLRLVTSDRTRAIVSTDELRTVIARTEKVIRDFAEHGIIPGKPTDFADDPSGELVGT